MKTRNSYAFPPIRCFAPRKAHIGSHVPASKNDNPCCFLKTSDNQSFMQFLQVFISYCLSKAYHNKKYKALILKYKAHILKYMACIFYKMPCVFCVFAKCDKNKGIFDFHKPPYTEHSLYGFVNIAHLYPPEPKICRSTSCSTRRFS